MLWGPISHLAISYSVTVDQGLVSGLVLTFYISLVFTLHAVWYGSVYVTVIVSGKVLAYFQCGSIRHLIIIQQATFVPLTHSLQWNSYPCILWLYSLSSVAIFVYVPNCCRSVIRMFTCLSQKQLLCYSQVGWLLLPNWWGSNNPEGICSQVKVKQTYMYFKNNEGIFRLLFSH